MGCMVQMEADLLNVNRLRSVQLRDPVYHELAAGKARGWSPNFGNYHAGITLGKVLSPSEGWLHKGTLRVVCRLSVGTDFQRVAFPAADTGQELSESLGNLLSSRLLSDVVIEVSGEEIEAHSAILAARSSVFATMFSAPMRESLEGRVVIEDLDMISVKELLRFLYTGEVSEEALSGNDTTIGLLKAAHRFEVISLVGRCTQALKATLNFETVSDRLQLADMMGCTAFKARCLEFMWQHIIEVQETAGYSQLVERQPSLLKDLVTVAAGPAPKRRRTDNGFGSC